MTVQTTAVIREPDRLANYVRLVAVTLDRLARIGGAYHEPVVENRTYALPQHV